MQRQSNNILYKTLSNNSLDPLAKLIPIAHHKDKQHNEGQDKADIKPHGIGERKPVARVGLVQKAVPAPASFMGTEQQIDQRTQRQDILRNQEVLNTRDIHTKDGKARPHIAPKYAGHGQYQHSRKVD